MPEVRKEFSLNLAAGEPSQEFFRHFNAVLSNHQRSARGTIDFHANGSSESLTIGRYVVDGLERSIEFRVMTSSVGQVETVAIACDDAESSAVVPFVEQLLRTTLANALSDKRTQFFQRRLLSYFGPVLEGEYWLPGFRFAPAIPEEPIEVRHRIDMERLVVLDFNVRAIDRNQSSVIASDFETSHLQKLSLLLNTNLEPPRQEFVWVIPEPSSSIPVDESIRCRRWFYPKSLVVAQMPRKGETCAIGRFVGSVGNYFRRTAGDLLTLPKESRALIRVASKAPHPEGLAVEACSRMYRLSLVLRAYSPSAALAYQVAAIDAIVSATRPRFDSVSGFIRHFCPDAQNSDNFLDYLYGTVRSGHFHSGSAPLDTRSRVPFQTLMDPFTSGLANLAFEAHVLVHRAITSWLVELAGTETAERVTDA